MLQLVHDEPPYEERRAAAAALRGTLATCLLELDRLGAGIAAAHCDMALMALRVRFELD